MAITKHVPGLEVTIQINGKRAPEYDDPHIKKLHDDEGVVTKYIECINDAEFAVVTKASEDYAWGYMDHVLVVEVCVDGKFMGNALLASYDKFPWVAMHGVKVQKPDGEGWALHKFKFSVVEIVDGCYGFTQGDLSIAHVGVIEARVFREVLWEKAEPDRLPHEATDQNLIVSEQTVKGLSVSHGTQLVREESTSTGLTAVCRSLPGDNGPIADFRFIYRSRDALKQEYVIPQSLSTGPMWLVRAYRNFWSYGNSGQPMKKEEELESKVKFESKVEKKPEIKPETSPVLDCARGSEPHGQSELWMDAEPLNESECRLMKSTSRPEIEPRLRSGASVKRGAPRFSELSEVYEGHELPDSHKDIVGLTADGCFSRPAKRARYGRTIDLTMM